MSSAGAWPFWVPLTAAVGLAAGVGGLWAGRSEAAQLSELKTTLRRQTAQIDALLAIEDARRSVGGQVAAPPPGGCGLDMNALRREIVGAVREELHAAPLAPGASAVAPEKPALTPENVQAEADGQRLVDGAIAAGRWGADEAQVLRLVLSRVTAEQGQALITALVVASNQGKLPTRSGPLY